MNYQLIKQTTRATDIQIARVMRPEASKEVQRDFIRRIKKGKVKMYRPEWLQRLSEWCGLPIEKLI